MRGWLAVVAQRRRFGYSDEEALEKAWRMIVERNPFPATMGRICPHPCESDCNRSAKDGAVAVNTMERFVGDWAIRKDLGLPVLETERKSETAGVIGAGPAGLSFAYQLARRGYSVTIYERSEAPGGMLRYGIPEYRLPRQVLDAEIERILDLGVDLRLKTKVGSEIHVDSLRERHDLLFVGIGAGVGRSLGIEGEAGPGVYSGIEFLAAYSRRVPPQLGRRVVVVGGGNTAIDAARCARRLRSDVTLVYRRTRAEMPAIEQEVDDAQEEGISIRFLESPVRVNRNEGRVFTVEVQQMELGDPDDSGRRTPLPVDGAITALPADSVIVAVAQQPDWLGLSPLGPGQEWISTDSGTEPGLWAGGDVIGPGLAAEAIAHGRRAAEEVHACGTGPPTPVEDFETICPTDLDLDFYPAALRVKPSIASSDRRIENPTQEVAATITATEFFKEAERCLSCGMCVGCGHCWMFCNAGAFTRVVEPMPGEHFVLIHDRCEACGKCLEVCPCGYLTLDPTA